MMMRFRKEGTHTHTHTYMCTCYVGPPLLKIFFNDSAHLMLCITCDDVTLCMMM